MNEFSRSLFILFAFSHLFSSTYISILMLQVLILLNPSSLVKKSTKACEAPEFCLMSEPSICLTLFFPFFCCCFIFGFSPFSTFAGFSRFSCFSTLAELCSGWYSFPKIAVNCWKIDSAVVV